MIRTRPETVLSWLLGLALFFFSFPKLTASDVSLALFGQINQFTGWQGRWFMYLTGVLELSVGLLMIGSLLLQARGHVLWLLSLLLIVGVMMGALFTEIAVRPGEDVALLMTATVILGVTLYLLLPRRNEVLALVPGSKRA